ncbi:MAG: hypothetical protein JSR31_07165 [Nitrospira sp.]|nr:hypothetical protein [Nitrospira sp.]
MPLSVGQIVLTAAELLRLQGRLLVGLVTVAWISPFSVLGAAEGIVLCYGHRAIVMPSAYEQLVGTEAHIFM